jgi:transcription antitermination factor NusG
VNERVKITTGPLMDQEGQVLEVKHKKATVAIDSLGYVLIASVEKSKLASVKIK